MAERIDGKWVFQDSEIENMIRNAKDAYKAMSTTEQIKALTKGTMLCDEWGFQAKCVNADDLIALAESHERLLKAAKAAHYGYRNVEDRIAHMQTELTLQSAIEEAEKI